MSNFLTTAINYLSCTHQDMINNGARHLSCSSSDWMTVVIPAILGFITAFIVIEYKNRYLNDEFVDFLLYLMMSSLCGVIIGLLAFELIAAYNILIPIIGIILLCYGFHKTVNSEYNIKDKIKNIKLPRWKKPKQLVNKIVEPDLYLQKATQEVEKILNYE